MGRYAAALAHGLGEGVPSVDLGPDGDRLVLELADAVSQPGGSRDVPLATFLAGCFVALRAAEGGDPEKAMEEALRVARRLSGGDRAAGGAC